MLDGRTRPASSSLFTFDGPQASDPYYLKALKVRTLIVEDFSKAWATVDALITPTSPVPAFKLGERVDDPLAMYLSDVLTIPCNLAGLPGISVPCGFTSSGLPIGLQVLGPAFEEARVLKIGHAYQQATDWHTRRPPLPEDETP